MGKWTMIDHSYDYTDDEVSGEQNEEELNTIEDKIRHFINDRNRNSNDIKLIICEGDSWFDYPDPGLLEHIFDGLKNNDKSSQSVIWGVVNIANAGDTLKEMIEQSTTLKSILKQYKDNIKCVLLSAGGNDIIDKLDGILDKNGINEDKLKEVMEGEKGLKKHYQNMIHIIYSNLGNNKIPIFTHSYAYVCNFGDNTCSILKKLFTRCPWIYPIMAKHELTPPKTYDAMKKIFNEFYSVINEIDGITITDTRKSMEVNDKCQSDRWIDEIHPKYSTVKNVANAYVKKIIKTSPNLLT